MRPRRLTVRFESHHVPSSRRLSKFVVEGPEGPVARKYLNQVRDRIRRAFPKLKLESDVKEGGVLVLIAPDDAVLDKALLEALEAKIKEVVAALKF